MDSRNTSRERTATDERIEANSTPSPITGAVAPDEPAGIEPHALADQRSPLDAELIDPARTRRQDES